MAAVQICFPARRRFVKTCGSRGSLGSSESFARQLGANAAKTRCGRQSRCAAEKPKAPWVEFWLSPRIHPARARASNFRLVCGIARRPLCAMSEGSAAGGEVGPVVASRRRGPAVGALVLRDKSMPPPAPRVKHAGPVVLDEDEYVARLDAIITREYFPDVPKLKDTLRWLQATNSGDPKRVREAQLAIQRRLARENGGSALGSPSFSFRLGDDDSAVHTAPTAGTDSGWETQNEAVDEWQNIDGDARSVPNTPSRGAVTIAAEAAEDAAAAAVAAADARLGIDGFLRTYTGEDNASFSAILEKQNSRKRLKQVAIETTNKDEATRALGNGENVFAKEPVLNDMFFREGNTGTAIAHTTSVQNQNQKYVTVARNTRFEAPGDDGVSVATTSSTPRNAYVTVATPLIEPGVGASPFMTWGELESTPTRLDGAAPASISTSPFRVAGVDRSEKTLRKMVKGMETKRKQSGVPGKQPLSRAALSLARHVHGDTTSRREKKNTSVSFEGSLRRTYQGTPRGMPRRPESKSATPARDRK